MMPLIPPLAGGSQAGLRPNEVRALRRRDIELRRNGDGRAIGGFVRVREGTSFGHTDTPKTG